MKQHIKRILGWFMTIALMVGLLPIGALSVAAADQTETRFVRVNSMEEIIPNARYILVGEYTSPLDGNVSYHVMGKYNSQRDGYRSSYAETQNDTEYFKMAEDLSELTLFSYGSVDNHEALIFRMSPNNVDKGRYYLRVGDNQYLFGFSRRVSDGAIGHHYHTCLPVDTQSYGNYWWRVSVSDSGQWQFVTQWKPSRAYEYQKIFFYGPSPLTSQQFRGNQVSTVNGGDWKDPNTIDNVGSDAETHVYLYREICAHEAEKVTYSPAVEAACNAAGMQANWYCAGCMQYYADEACTQLLKMVDAYTPALPHNFVDGICTGCGAEVYRSVFVPKGNDSSVGSSDDGKKYIVVAKDGDQYYAMGPIVGDTVSAVPVTLKQGAIEISNVEAGILTFDFYNVFPYGYIADGGLLTAYGDKIILRDPTREGDQEPGPMDFWGDYDEEFGCARAETNGSYSYMVFVPANGDTPAHFRAQSERVDNITLYEEACKHVNRYEQPYVAPTCTKQGSIAYIYCEDCWCYYHPDNLLQPLDSEYGMPSFGIPATGHDFNDEDVCNHCGMYRPVYAEVTDYATLNALPEDAYYIFVGEYDGQTYVGALPPYNPFTADSDGDGTVDAAQIDEDSDGIPDYLNVDLDESGVCDYLECYDEEIGEWDEWRIYDLLWQLEEQYNYEILPLYSNAEMVIPNADGTISTKGMDRPIEFQMMWMEDEAYRLENPDDPWAQARVFWTPNHWIVANDMGYYYNHFHAVWQNGMESFREADSMEFGHWVISANESGDYYVNNLYNAQYEPDRLRLRIRIDTEGNKTVEFVNMGEWLENENLPEDMVSQEFVTIRLYASVPQYAENAHTCEFGAWTTSDENIHTRSCACGAVETAPHTFDDGVVTTEPTHTTEGVKTYTCGDCGYAYTETVPTIPGHTFGSWEIGNDAEHTRSCACGAVETAPHAFDDGVVTTEPTHTTEGVKTYTCGDCGYAYTEAVPTIPGHTFGSWEIGNDAEHTRSCACGAVETAPHAFDDGVVTTEPTHTTEGVKTYTCGDCGYAYTETVSTIPGHTFGNWEIGNDAEHTRSCACGAVETAPHAFDDGVVTTEPTHTTEGVKTYTCGDCGYAYTETVPTIPGHTFGSWEIGNDAEHTRSCACGAVETAPHAFDDGVVTTEPTHTTEGVKTYTCGDCDYTYTETVPALPTVDKVEDTENGITIDANDPAVVLPADTQLVVEKLPADAINPDLNIVGDGAAVLQSYNISLVSNGVEIQPGGQVLVTVPAPVGMENYTDIQVVYIDDFGNVTPCVTTINEDGTITFVTDHFSVYAVVGILAIVPGDANGDGKINNRDLGLLQQHLNGWHVDLKVEAMDVNDDGKINNRDLGLFQQYLNEWDVELK